MNTLQKIIIVFSFFIFIFFKFIFIQEHDEITLNSNIKGAIIKIEKIVRNHEQIKIFNGKNNIILISTMRNNKEFMIGDSIIKSIGSCDFIIKRKDSIITRFYDACNVIYVSTYSLK